jgi:hypothetical protein
MALRVLAVVPALALVLLAGCVAADDKVDLPVATSGFEAWTSVVAKAMSYGGKNQAESLKALQSFQSDVMAKMQKTGAAFQKLQHGDVTDFLVKLVSPNVQISKPVFFSSAPAVLTDTLAAISFSFTGVGVSPCAVPIVPTGVGIFPQGVNINPIGAYITPIGVNVQPQGANISPTLIVIGPYDTTVAGQGLNIAPALISVAPVRTVVNPVGPLAIADTLISATVPTPP